MADFKGVCSTGLVGADKTSICGFASRLPAMFHFKIVVFFFFVKNDHSSAKWLLHFAASIFFVVLLMENCEVKMEEKKKFAQVQWDFDGFNKISRGIKISDSAFEHSNWTKWRLKIDSLSEMKKRKMCCARWWWRRRRRWKAKMQCNGISTQMWIEFWVCSY